MAIRIRNVDGVTVALCAARTFAKEGDIYLDDAAHYALTIKFGEDFNVLPDEGITSYPRRITIMRKEEIEDNGYNEIKNK